MEWILFAGKLFGAACVSLVGAAIAIGLCVFVMNKFGLGEEEIGAGLGYVLGSGVIGFLLSAVMSYFIFWSLNG